MAAGDFITRDGQYEFLGLLMNGLDETNVVKVMRTQGLFDIPPFKSFETELDDDHGGTVGRQLMTKRRITMELEYLSPSKTLMMNSIDVLNWVFQPRQVISPLVYQRAGAKRVVNVRTSRFTGLDSNYVREHGRASATVEFVAPDPRKFAYAQSVQAITIAASALNQSGTVTHGGLFVGGAQPILEIAGPATNPRIQNAGDEGRTIRLDMTIAAGQTLILNTRDRTAFMGGVDQADKIRTDNQWWVLHDGPNLITYSRSLAPATASTLTVKWWNSWA